MCLKIVEPNRREREAKRQAFGARNKKEATRKAHRFVFELISDFLDDYEDRDDEAELANKHHVPVADANRFFKEMRRQASNHLTMASGGFNKRKKGKAT